MARVLVRLKLAILRRGLRGRRAVMTVLGALYGIVGAAGSLLLPLAASSVDVAAALTAVVVTAWALGWIAGPLVLGGGDETIRPENFALLPLRPTELARGMLAASLVGVPPVVTLIAFGSHVLAALGGGVAALVAAVLGAGLELALVVLASRVVVAALSAVLATRRGRDLGVLLSALGALAFLPLNLVSRSIGPLLSSHGAGLGTTGTVLTALPTGWGALAVREAAAGAPLLGAAALVGLAALDAGLLVLWGRLLRRRLSEAADTGGTPSRRARRDPERTGTVPERGPLGAVLRRELRMWRRDARRRSAMAVVLVLGLVLPALVTGEGARGLAFAPLWLVWFAATQFGNLYGLDGSAVWHLLAAPEAVRADVRGRQLGWLVVVAPIALIAAGAGPVLTGRPGTAVWVLALTPALLGAGAGLVVLQSAYLPFAVPQGRDARAFSTNRSSGAGCARGLTALAFSLLLAAAALPEVAVVGAGSWLHHDVLAWAGVPVGIAVGVVLAWWWGELARRRVDARGPEILSQVRAPA